MAGPWGGSNDHVKMAVPSLVGDLDIVSPISSIVLNTLIKCFFLPGYTDSKTVKFIAKNRPQCHKCLKDNYPARRDVGLTQGRLILKEHGLYRA